MVRLVLFDIDGTLVHTGHAGTKAFAQTFAHIFGLRHGSEKMKFAGRCYPSGRRAVNGLYDYELATYDAADAFRHEDAAGFVRLWGLSVETVARRQGGLA